MWTPLENETEDLALDASEAVRVAFEVPAGGRLLSGVELEPDAELHVRLLEDGEEPLVETQSWPAARAVTLDLDARAGRFVVVEFEARGGRVTLASPAVYVPTPTPAAARPSRPNILVFLSDTLRADHLPLFNPQARPATPALDELGRTGTVFEHTYAPANWTKPNVATVLTGLEPWQHGATTHTASLPEGIRTLPQYLQEAGYFTGAFATNGYISSTFGFERGFDTWRGHGDGPVDAATISREVGTWLARRPHDRPFFLYVHTTDCHAPYLAKTRDVASFDPAPYRGVANFRRHRQLLNEVRSGVVELSARDVVRLEALYNASIQNQDRALARILRSLQTLELEQDTVVVFIADHGEEFLDHGSVGHGATLWNELLHIPFVMRIPGASAPSRVSTPVGSDSVTPTLLELAGVAIPEELRGLSLVPYLGGDRGSIRGRAIGGIRSAQSMTTSSYKLIVRIDHGVKTPELYDLRADTAETHDLAAERPLTTHFLTRAIELRRGQEPPMERSSVTLDPALEAQLRALGYVGSQRAN